MMMNSNENEVLGEDEYDENGDVDEENIRRPLPLWATPPWPEWSDSAIDIEVWEENESVQRFVDPTGSILPPTIRPVRWIRPEALLEPAILVDWSATKIDLINANIHICEKSDMIRFMLSEISELYDYGLSHTFQLEGEGTVFIPNSDHHNASWKPWDHIYSRCKAGVKGDKPTMNRIGKYYVRLYFMGAWRRITVDDRIPLIKDDILGLPISSSNELWPLILVKALVKLASLSWSHEISEGLDKVHRFSTISALTGWVHEWIDVENPISSHKLWKELNDMLPKYNGQAQITSNFWTTGKTKKERTLEEIAADKMRAEKQSELPHDLAKRWWTLTPLVSRDPDMDYLEYSDSDGGESIANESEYPSSTAQSLFSVSEMDAADEAEEDTEFEELAKKKQQEMTAALASTKKGKKEKSRKKRGDRERSKSIVDISAIIATSGEETKIEDAQTLSETEAAEAADGFDTDKDESSRRETSKSSGKKEGKKGGAKKDKKKNSTDRDKSQTALIEESMESVGGQVEFAETGGPGNEIAIQTGMDDLDGGQKSFLKPKTGPGGKGKAPGKRMERLSEKIRKKRSTRFSMRMKKFQDVVDSIVSVSLDDEETEDETLGSLEFVADDEQLQTKAQGSKESKKSRKYKQSPPTELAPVPPVEPAPEEPPPIESKKLSFIVSKEVVKPLKRVKVKIPMIQDILAGVQKYLGTDNAPLVDAWESIVGKTLPDAITVVLSLYPRVEEQGTIVPSFLYHPINFVEVRDTPLAKDPDRPKTPLWKSFRWKGWAMKKGLIPMETDPDQIRCIKAKTPFALKTHWYHSRLGMTHVETLTRKSEEEEEEEHLLGYAPQGTAIEDVCGGGRPPGGSPVPVIEIVSVNVDQPIVPTPGAARTSVPLKTPTTTAGDARPKRRSSGKKLSISQKKLSTGSNPGGGTKGRNSRNSHTPHKEDPHNHLTIHPSHHSTHSGGLHSRHSTGAGLGGHHHKKHGHGTKGGKGGKERDISNSDDETWLGEVDENESAPLPTPASDIGPMEIIPSTACGSVWFHCDNVSSYIRKICKFYSTRTIFGSCFTLRRKPEWVGETNTTSPIQITLTPDEIPDKTMVLAQNNFADLHAVPDSFNLTIQFEKFKVLNVENFHLDKSAGVESAFYLFSDCWMEQEILISLDVLQALDITGYAEKTNTIAWNYAAESDMYKNSPEDEESTAPLSSVNVGVVLEPWDWRKDCCMQKPLVHFLTDTHWSAHVTLRPGRSMFRIWVAENPEEGEGVYNANPYTMSPYVVKFSAKTPIHIGPRDEMFNYMTNEPVLLLKQAENLAQNIWTLFILFGRPKASYAISLRSLHKSYCPSYQEPNVINRKLKNVHVSFENKFLALVTELNQGPPNRMMILAMRCLFLNPSLGEIIIDLVPPTPSAEQEDASLLPEGGGFDITEAKEAATLVIQSYLRGWLVRRLFLFRTKGHPKYPRIEYQIRKIAYLLACNTDSTLTQTIPVVDPVVSTDAPPPDQKAKSEQSLLNMNSNISLEQGEEENGENTATVDPASHSAPESSPNVAPTLVPNPPKWAVKLLNDLLKEFPLLISLYPHAYCLPHHVRIRDTEGVMPSLANDSHCAPFFRRVVSIVGEGNWCTCLIQLQVTPATNVVLRVIDNDTETCLEAPTLHFFLGKLQYNKNGYTILCYRLINESSFSPEQQEEMPLCHHWKIRIVTPRIQEHLVYADEIHQHHHHHHHHHIPPPPQESSTS